MLDSMAVLGRVMLGYEGLLSLTPKIKTLCNNHRVRSIRVEGYQDIPLHPCTPLFDVGPSLRQGSVVISLWGDYSGSGMFGGVQNKKMFWGPK